MNRKNLSHVAKMFYFAAKHQMAFIKFNVSMLWLLTECTRGHLVSGSESSISARRDRPFGFYLIIACFFSEDGHLLSVIRFFSHIYVIVLTDNCWRIIFLVKFHFQIQTIFSFSFKFLFQMVILFSRVVVENSRLCTM